MEPPALSPKDNAFKSLAGWLAHKTALLEKRLKRSWSSVGLGNRYRAAEFYYRLLIENVCCCGNSSYVKMGS